MSDNEQHGLQRLDFESRLPAGFDKLTEPERHDIMRRLVDQDLELRKELGAKWGKSKIAEHDLAVAVEAVRRLDHERKIYSEHYKRERPDRAPSKPRFAVGIQGSLFRFWLSSA